MKKLAMFAAMFILAFSVYGKTVYDVYDLVITLKVPQVFNNNTSQGYRKYQTQKIKGFMSVTYDTKGNTKPIIDVFGLENKTFKVRSKYVTYESEVNDDEISSRLVRIGSNKTGKFNTASICFYVEAVPNYALGDVDEDNSFYLLFAGSGTCTTAKKSGVNYIKKMSGRVTGTQGCSCYAYGHVSPTRTAGYCGPTDQVEDVACVYGSWTAKINKNNGRYNCYK